MVKDFLISVEFVTSPIKRGLFMLHRKAQCIVHTAVGLHLDELSFIAKECWFPWIKNQKKKRFRMEDFGSDFFCLGMNIKHNRVHYTIDSTEYSHIWMMLALFRIDESRPVSTPRVKKCQKKNPIEVARDSTIYQSMLGSLMNKTTATWRNIAHTIGVRR